MQFSAESAEVEAVHRDFTSVTGFRDAQVLTVQCDQIQTELGLLSIPSAALEDDLKRGALLFVPKSNLVLVACQLQNLSQVGDRHTESHGAVGTVVHKAMGGEAQRNQSDV